MTGTNGKAGRKGADGTRYHCRKTGDSPPTFVADVDNPAPGKPAPGKEGGKPGPAGYYVEGNDRVTWDRKGTVLGLVRQ